MIQAALLLMIEAVRNRCRNNGTSCLNGKVRGTRYEQAALIILLIQTSFIGTRNNLESYFIAFSYEKNEKGSRHKNYVFREWSLYKILT